VAVMSGHQDGVSSVQWQESGKWVLSGGFDMTVRLWDTNTYK
jgi:WD40 repeat protein